MPRRALILVAALGLAGCFGGPPPSGGTPTGGPPAAVPPVACQSASEAETSVVTVESTPTGPEITSTPVDSQQEADAVVAEAAADGDLVAAEPDLPRGADNDAPSNDTRRAEQWALNNVNFEDAWASASSGGTGQVVAVIDSGVQASHPDLAGQVLAGQYFLHSDDGGSVFSGPGGTTDGNGHGTHVAGIIGAVAGNAAGVTGAAPGVDILPVQVLCPDGGGFSSDVANGITWATNNGADVINLSLGGSGQSQAELTAIQYARSQGVVVVASAGNSGNGSNAPSYPGAFDEVIAVAALLNDNTKAGYSTTGSYVDVAAPGGTGTSSATGVLSTWNNGGYVALSGTSMASPHVAAAAALVRAAHGFTTHSDVCNQLIRTADDLGALGADSSFGNGRVDPLEAVGAVFSPVVPGVTPTCT